MNTTVNRIIKYNRYLRSIFRTLLLFGFRYRSLYLGKNIFFEGKFQLGNHMRIYDNSKIVGNVRFGDNCSLSENVEVRSRFEEIVIGNNCTINRNTIIIGKVYIDDDCLIAPDCVIAGSNHMFDEKMKIRDQKVVSKGIHIHSDVWLGANVTVLDGVSIGEGSIIGAGSVVVNDIPNYSVAVGNPCRVIKQRYSDKDGT